ncbi:hypothetical protein SDJN03_02289, partial [Cucurbita argyrosperma subsp. sororia]
MWNRKEEETFSSQFHTVASLLRASNHLENALIFAHQNQKWKQNDQLKCLICPPFKINKVTTFPSSKLPRGCRRFSPSSSRGAARDKVTIRRSLPPSRAQGSAGFNRSCDADITRRPNAPRDHLEQGNL